MSVNYLSHGDCVYLGIILVGRIIAQHIQHKPTGKEGIKEEARATVRYNKGITYTGGLSCSTSMEFDSISVTCVDCSPSASYLNYDKSNEILDNTLLTRCCLAPLSKSCCAISLISNLLAIMRGVSPC